MEGQTVTFLNDEQLETLVNLRNTRWYCQAH